MLPIPQGEDALRTGEWVLSEDKKYAEQESRVRIEPCDLEGRVFAADKGILLAESHKHYGLGSTFDKPVDNQGKVFKNSNKPNSRRIRGTNGIGKTLVKALCL